MRNVESLPQLPLPDRVEPVLGTYWTPNIQFIDELVQFLQGRKVLEIFAGNGYLAALLHERGIVITSTTLLTGHDAHERGLYFPVEELDAVQAVAQYGASHDVLLICWPTTTNVVLHAVSAWGPDKDVVFIGEVTDYSKGPFWLGGCATDAFFEQMDFDRKFPLYQGNMLESAMVGRLKRAV